MKQKKSGARIVINRRGQPPHAAEPDNRPPPQPAKARQTGDDAVRELPSFPLFKDIPAKIVSDFDAACRKQHFEHGHKIVEKGDKSDDVYFLLAGEAHVLNFTPSGRVIDFSVLRPGDFFGELVAIDGLPRSATVVTAGPCRIASVEGAKFIELLTTYSSVTMTVLRRMASIIRSGDERITDLSVLDAEQRLCLELLRLAKPDPALLDNLAVFPVPTQKLLASNIGVARETVARIFARLANNGIIERKAKTLYIRDKMALEELTLPTSGNV